MWVGNSELICLGKKIHTLGTMGGLRCTNLGHKGTHCEESMAKALLSKFLEWILLGVKWVEKESPINSDHQAK